MTARSSFVSIPSCPTCDRPLGYIEAWKARRNRFDCPSCGSALRIPNGKQTALAIMAFIGLYQIDRALPSPDDIIIIAIILLGFGTLEYLMMRVTLSNRTHGKE